MSDGSAGIAATIAGAVVIVIASAAAACWFVRRRQRQRVHAMRVEKEMVRFDE